MDSPFEHKEQFLTFRNNQERVQNTGRSVFSQQLDYYTPHPDHVYSQQVDAYAHIDRRLLDRYDEERLSFRNLRSMRSQDKYAVTKIDIGIIDGHNEQSQKAKNEMLLNKLARLTKGIGKEQRKQLVTASQIDEQEQLIETDCRSIERQHTAIDQLRDISQQNGEHLDKLMLRKQELLDSNLTLIERCSSLQKEVEHTESTMDSWRQDEAKQKVYLKDVKEGVVELQRLHKTVTARASAVEKEISDLRDYLSELREMDQEWNLQL